jgi:hypothetical protein
MKKYLLLTITMLFIIILSGCGILFTALIQALIGSHAGFIFIPAAIAAKENGQKYGMVVLTENLPPENYKPAAGATVYIEGTTLTAKTGDDGFFKLTDIPAGITTLKVEYPDFLPFEEKIVVTDPNAGITTFNTLKIIPEQVLMPVGVGGTVEFTAYGETQGNIPVIPDTNWAVVNDIGTIDKYGIFTAKKSGTGLIIATSGSKRAEVTVTVVEKVGTIKGHVKYNGNSVTDAQIKVNGTNQYTMTDSNGNYILPGIPATDVTVTATSSSTGKKGSLNVTVPAGGEITLDINLEDITPFPDPLTPTPTGTPVMPVGNIQGKLLEYDGTTPVVNGYILFYSYLYPAMKESKANPNAITSSDSSGNYTFSNIPQGSGLIECWRSESDYTADPNNPFAKTDVNVVNGTTVVDIKSLYAPTPTVTPEATATPTPTPGYWGANIKVSDVSNVPIGAFPRIAVDTSGNAYAVWADNRNGNMDIYFSYKPSGGTWGANVRVDNDSTGNDAKEPDIAVDVGGNACAVWVDHRDGALSPHIYFARRPAGGIWQDHMKVDDNTTPVIVRNPAIAVSATGVPYVIWVDTRNTDPKIYFAYYNSGMWNGNYAISTGGVFASSPDIAADASGNLYAVWSDRRNGNNDIYASYRPDPSVWGANVRIDNDTTGSNAVSPRVAVDSSGNAYAIWQDYRNGNPNIYFSYTSGGLWQTTNQRVDDSTATMVGLPDIGVDSTGNAYAVWSDRRNGNWDIYSSFRSAGGSWGANAKVDDAPGTTDVKEPAIGVNPSGKAQAIWEDQRNGGNEIYSSESR